MIAKVAVAVAAWMAFGGSALDYRLHVIIAPSYRFAATSTTYIASLSTLLCMALLQLLIGPRFMSSFARSSRCGGDSRG